MYNQLEACIWTIICGSYSSPEHMRVCLFIYQYNALPQLFTCFCTRCGIRHMRLSIHHMLLVLGCLTMCAALFAGYDALLFLGATERPDLKQHLGHRSEADTVSPLLCEHSFCAYVRTPLVFCLRALPDACSLCVCIACQGPSLWQRIQPW